MKVALLTVVIVISMVGCLAPPPGPGRGGGYGRRGWPSHEEGRGGVRGQSGTAERHPRGLCKVVYASDPDTVLLPERACPNPDHTCDHEVTGVFEGQDALMYYCNGAGVDPADQGQGWHGSGDDSPYPRGMCKVVSASDLSTVLFPERDCPTTNILCDQAITGVFEGQEALIFYCNGPGASGSRGHGPRSQGQHRGHGQGGRGRGGGRRW